ncbi:MAG: hypothetical protein CMC79_04835 [Flavobacteriaceae bacterium]|nr:hypothetical protein [Flavobacteriaceae bacterium]|tara:strand:- start:6477 stop:7244 length:768 start_codon:yes stop_codon:yes gene_type:complete
MKRVKQIFSLTTLILFVNVSFIFSQNEEEVLFIGNSFTFYWNLPSIVEKMAEERSLNWNVTQSTAGGATLKDHWNGDKKLITRELIRTKPYTSIIFQDHSTYPIIAIDTTKKYYTQFKNLLPLNTKTYFYSTWMYPKMDDSNRNLDTQNPIEKNIVKANINKSSKLLMIGRAFDTFKSKYPEYKLLTDDMKHPSPNGSYLAACVVFSTLSNQSSKGLSRRYIGKDSNGKKIYYIILETEVAKKCQEISDLIVFNK